MTTPTWFPTAILIHVTTAIASIILGIFAMRTNMKPKQHRKVGMAYAVIMTISLVTAVIMLTVRFNIFLTLVTVLSVDSLYLGFRAAKRKSRKPVTWYDWAVTSVTGAFAAGFFVYGILGITGIGALDIPPVIAYIGIGFSLLLGSNVRDTARFYSNPPTDRRAWLLFHANAMLGSYLALIVAMCVTMSRYLLPAEVQWLAWAIPPTIGGILLSRYMKKLQGRYQRRSVPAIGD